MTHIICYYLQKYAVASSLEPWPKVPMKMRRSTLEVKFKLRGQKSRSSLKVNHKLNFEV